MACLGKNDFKNPQGLKTVRVDLPEHGDGAYINVRELPSGKLFLLQKTDTEDKKLVTACYELLSECLVDDDGNLLFSSPDDMAENFNQPLSVLEFLLEKMTELSSLKKTDSTK